MLRGLIQLALVPAKVVVDLVFSAPETEDRDPLVVEDEERLGYEMGLDFPTTRDPLMVPGGRGDAGCEGEPRA